MGHQLYGVIYRDSWTEKTKNGKDKKRPTTFRGFSEVTPDRDNVVLIESELARLRPQWEESDVLAVGRSSGGKRPKAPHLRHGEVGEDVQSQAATSSRTLRGVPSKNALRTVTEPWSLGRDVERQLGQTLGSLWNR